MAYADDTTGGRVIEYGIGPVEVALSAAVECGDLLGVSSSTWVRADANAEIYAELVAGIAGASGDVITAYRIARVSGVTGGTKGAALYLSDTVGESSESAGTVKQIVGVVLTATSILLCPSSGGASLPVGYKQIGKVLVHDKTATEAVSADKTLAIDDSGVIQLVDTDAKTVTLPATVVGYHFTVMNNGADGAVLVTISPDSADKIAGGGYTAVDNKDLTNTKATARKGDYVKLLGDGVNGWFITEIVGTWAYQG